MKATLTGLCAALVLATGLFASAPADALAIGGLIKKPVVFDPTPVERNWAATIIVSGPSNGPVHGGNPHQFSLVTIYGGTEAQCHQNVSNYVSGSSGASVLVPCQPVP